MVTREFGGCWQRGPPRDWTYREAGVQGAGAETAAGGKQQALNGAGCPVARIPGPGRFPACSRVREPLTV